MNLPTNQIVCGDARAVLATLPAGSVNCCISSPPYWALRAYGTNPQVWDGDGDCKHKWGVLLPAHHPGQVPQTKHQIASGSKDSGNFCSKCGAWCGELGLEPTFELYIKHLCDIYDEVWRALRPDGTCFVNLGDTYGGTKVGNTEIYKNPKLVNNSFKKSGGTEKSLCLIPQRFAIEMVNRGWILRNTIIWHKPNPMPSSAKDRFTVDFEYVFFFVKNNDILWHFRPDGKVSDRQPYYKDGIEGLDWEWGTRKGKRVKTSLWQGLKYWFEPQYEPYLTESNAERPRMGQGQNTQYNQKRGEIYTGQDTKDYISARAQSPSDSKRRILESIKSNPLGRNKRTVWTIPTQSYPEAHFATFPEKLVEPMIKAGCPEFICTKCGKAREKIYDVSYIPDGNRPAPIVQQSEAKAEPSDDKCGARPQALKHGRANASHHFKGYTDCGCKDREWRPGIVLDMFRWKWDYVGCRRPVAA